MKLKFDVDIGIYSENLLKEVVALFNDVAVVKYKSGKLEIFGDNEDEIIYIFNEFMNLYIYVFNLNQ